MWRGAEGSEGSLVWPQPSLGLQPLCNGVTLPSRTLPLSLPLWPHVTPKLARSPALSVRAAGRGHGRRGAERSLPDTARPEIETRGHELNTLQSLLCLQQEVQLRAELSSAWMGTGALTWAGRAGVLLCWCQQEQLCEFPLCPPHSVGCLDNAPRSGWAVPASKHPTVSCGPTSSPWALRVAQAGEGPRLCSSCPAPPPWELSGFPLGALRRSQPSPGAGAAGGCSALLTAVSCGCDGCCSPCPSLSLSLEPPASRAQGSAPSLPLALGTMPGLMRVKEVI